MPKKRVDDSTLTNIRDALQACQPGKHVRAWQIRAELKKMSADFDMDESTIRGRFLQMNSPLHVIGVGNPGRSSYVNTQTQQEKPEPEPKKEEPITQFIEINRDTENVPEDMKKYIPDESEFDNYVERDIDKRLSTHLDIGKTPLVQGKQGTGKTYSYMHYAYKRQIPFFLFSCYEDMKLQKLYGDKTIQEGSVRFVESLFTKATQCPSLILFDEVNAISNQNTFDFHALLQNRELFIKDANDGNGKLFKLHPKCRIGFAQNPKSSKYIGGNIKPSNFLGRCTYITYPEFSKDEIKETVKKKFPGLSEKDMNKFVDFYFACIETIDKAGIPVDISIRQLNHVIELFIHGLPLKHSIEDGMTSITEAISQPKLKDSFYRIAQAVWEELMNESQEEKVGE